MKGIQLLTVLMFVVSMNISCTGQTNTKEGENEALNAVEVFYFHLTRRCATCKTVEAESRKAVNELYGDEVSFTSYNLEEASGEQKADKLGVSGQTLLIVGGDKKINITPQGFMNARNPEKLKQIIKDHIDPLL